MQKTLFRRAVLLGALVAVVAGAATVQVVRAPSAIAMPGLTIVTEASAVDSSSEKYLYVRCPTDKRIIGGGANIAGPTKLTGLVQSYPFSGAPNDAWVVAAGEKGGGTTANWTLHGYAICASDPTYQVHMVASSTNWNSSTVKSTQTTCPAGKVAIAAGGAASVMGSAQPAGVSLTQYGVTTTGTGAAGMAVEDDAGTPVVWSYTTYALCAPPTAGYAVVMGVVAGNSESPKATAAYCPPNTKVHSSGAMVSGATGAVRVNKVHPNTALTSIVAGATERAEGTSENWSLVAVAVCAA